MGAREPTAVVIDVNGVRLAALLGAVRDLRRWIAEQVTAYPEWLDDGERVRWGVALGHATRAVEQAVEDALAVASEEFGILRAHQRLVESLGAVARWCAAGAAYGSEEVDVVRAVAMRLVANELEPIVRNANRAPGWLRRRGLRRAGSSGSADRPSSFPPEA